MRLNGIRKKLYLMTYDKPALNKKAMQLRTSIDEVKKMLGSPQNSKSSRK